MRREAARGAGRSVAVAPSTDGVSLCSARGNQRVYTTPHPCYLLTVQLVHTLISAGRTKAKRYAARTRWAEPPRRPAPRRLTPLRCSCLSSGGYFQWQWRLFPMAMPMPMAMAFHAHGHSTMSTVYDADGDDYRLLLPSTTTTSTTTTSTKSKTKTRFRITIADSRIGYDTAYALRDGYAYATDTQSVTRHGVTGCTRILSVSENNRHMIFFA